MTTYSTSLKLALIADGGEVGLWGQTTNTNLGTLLEQAITGTTSINMGDANVTLTSLNGATDQARNQVLILTGANNGVRDVIPPVVKKTYIVVNNTTGGYAIRVIGSSGTGVTVPNGTTSLIYCNGTNFYEAINSNTITGNSAISGGLTVGGAISGTTASFSGAISSVSPAFTGTPTAPTAVGGTNSTQIATTAFVNSSVTTFSNTLGTMSTQNANNVSITGGSITGITDLAVADGGTGASAFAANNVLLGNGSSSFQVVAPGTSGNVLTSNGTTWTSAAGGGLGNPNQTYQNVFGSRSNGSTYTNGTSAPIFVMVWGSDNSGQPLSLSITVNGVTLPSQSGSPSGSNKAFTFIVPPGQTYSVSWNSSANLTEWYELR